MKYLIISAGFILFLSSCVTVHPYERQYVSDSEMQMNTDAGTNFKNYVFSIREGAAPAGSSKAGGGCGCN